jgi:hypothetical protein
LCACVCFSVSNMNTLKTSKQTKKTFYVKTRGRKHLHAIQFTVFTNITTHFFLSLSLYCYIHTAHNYYRLIDPATAI